MAGKKFPEQENAHVLTDEDRAKGNQARWAKVRADREKAQQLILERLADHAEKTVKRHQQLIDGDDDRVAATAIHEHYERVFGKGVQAEAGDKPIPVEVSHTVDDLAGIASLLAQAGALPAAEAPHPADD